MSLRIPWDCSLFASPHRGSVGRYPATRQCVGGYPTLKATSGVLVPSCGSEFGVAPRPMPLAYSMSLRGEENSVPPHGALNDMHRGFDMMQLDVGDELGRGGVGMGWAEVVLWVRGVDTARFLFFKTLFP